MIKTGIIEGAGFSGGELIRLLLNHPDVHLIFITGRGNSGQYIHEVHRGLYGETELRFAEEPQLDKIDLLFLCTDAEEISIAREQDVYSLIYRIQEEVHRYTITRMENASATFATAEPIAPQPIIPRVLPASSVKGAFQKQKSGLCCQQPSCTAVLCKPTLCVHSSKSANVICATAWVE